MRVRLQSSLPDVILGCWYEIPQDSKNAYIEDLILQLHSDLDLSFPSTELGLELDDFDLPRRSRIEGVLREGDILNVKHNQDSRHFGRFATMENQLADQCNHLHYDCKPRLLNRREYRDHSGVVEDKRLVETSNGSNGAASEAGSGSEWLSDTTSTHNFSTETLKRTVRAYRRRCADLDRECQQSKVLKGELSETKRLLEWNKIKFDDNREELLELNKRLNKDLQDRETEIEMLRSHSSIVKQQFEQLCKVQDDMIDGTRQEDQNRAKKRRLDTILIPSDGSEHANSRSASQSSSDDMTASSASSSSSSTSSSSSEVEELSSRPPVPLKEPSPKVPSTLVVPGYGSPATATRNDRRKRKRTLERLIEAGVLPEGSNFKTLEEYQVAREEGTVVEWQEKVFAAAQQVKPGQGNGQNSTWDYPAEPEEGWETRLVVKEIECESMRTEERLPVKQVTEELRDRKRLRGGEDLPLVGTTSHGEREDVYEGSNGDVIIDADMYGDAEVVVSEAVKEDALTIETKEVEDVFEEGQVESVESHSDSSTSDSSSPSVSSSSDDEIRVLDGKVPSLPADTSSLLKIDLSSEYLSKPGAVIAFKHLEMVNFRPSFSKYKSGRVLQVKDDSLVLLLAEADVQEPMYDYEGDRVPGPFDHWNEEGNLVEGQVEIPLHQLLDVLLVST